MARKVTIGNRIAPARFILFLAVLGAGWAGGIAWLGWEQGLMAGFDLAALSFLLGCVPLTRLGAKELRSAAEENDANRWILLAISFLLTIVILTAITVQLGAGAELGLQEKML